ncbi:hypothetical protein GJ496_009059 [Pomphorhynchus laevis]|nr:hypothetical protein GJ496_009059 [Pomphorhynchus laevis]
MDCKPIEQLSLREDHNYGVAQDGNRNKDCSKSSRTVSTVANRVESMTIPTCQFIDDLEKYVKADGRHPKQILQEMTTLLKKYKAMSENVEKRISNLYNVTLADLKQSTSILNKLHTDMDQNKEVIADFSFSGNVKLKAIIPPVKKVGLWLGAKVMVEYTIDEAEDVIKTNTRNVENAIAKCNENLANLNICTQVNVSKHDDSCHIFQSCKATMSSGEGDAVMDNTLKEVFS